MWKISILKLLILHQISLKIRTPISYFRTSNKHRPLKITPRPQIDWRSRVQIARPPQGPRTRPAANRIDLSIQINTNPRRPGYVRHTLPGTLEHTTFPPSLYYVLSGGLFPFCFTPIPRLFCTLSPAPSRAHPGHSRPRNGKNQDKIPPFCPQNAGTKKSALTRRVLCQIAVFEETAAALFQFYVNSVQIYYKFVFSVFPLFMAFFSHAESFYFTGFLRFLQWVQVPLSLR